MALILASASPRRKELMQMITPEFRVMPLHVPEQGVTAPTPAQLAQKLSEMKCRAAALRCPYDVIIGCDTVVEYNGLVFGKPKDAEDARRMLRTLAGRTHLVHTGVCVFYDGSETEFVTTTRVSFLPVSDEDIDAYIATGDPMDKAGAYGIQGTAARFVEGIQGCYYNVMGLPVSRLYQTLSAMGVLPRAAEAAVNAASAAQAPATAENAAQQPEAKASAAQAPAAEAKQADTETKQDETEKADAAKKPKAAPKKKPARKAKKPAAEKKPAPDAAAQPAALAPQA